MKVNENFVLREIYGKHLLMPIRKNTSSDDPIFLNEIAAEIWKLCEKDCSVDDIIQNFMDNYNLANNSAEILAVHAFLKELKKIELIAD